MFGNSFYHANNCKNIIFNFDGSNISTVCVFYEFKRETVRKWDSLVEQI